MMLKITKSKSFIFYLKKKKKKKKKYIIHLQHNDLSFVNIVISRFVVVVVCAYNILTHIKSSLVWHKIKWVEVILMNLSIVENSIQDAGFFVGAWVRGEDETVTAIPNSHKTVGKIQELQEKFILVLLFMENFGQIQFTHQNKQPLYTQGAS